MRFLNRDEERKRLDRVMKLKEGVLVVLWGRRRVGKTRLLVEWTKCYGGVYWVASQTSSQVHIMELAQVIGDKVEGFRDIPFTSWDQLFKRLVVEVKRSKWKGPLVLDEFPYMVEAAKELPSILQRYLDHGFKEVGLKVAIAGSSQRMMQGLVLDGNAPLYGRARELMKIMPLAPKYIKEGLAIKSPRDAVKSYAVWGGIPRYWELGEPYGADVEGSILDLVLNPLGVLHQEPRRLLLEEGTSLLAVKPVLDIVGKGVHRLSEIAGRLGQPSSSLSYALTRLMEMDILEREVPFGELEKSGKKALYKIKDPFFRFWFEVVGGRLSTIIQGEDSVRQVMLEQALPRVMSQAWEELCRCALMHLRGVIPGCKELVLTPAGRYWGKGEGEWDIVSMSLDNKLLVLGEAKWLARAATAEEVRTILGQLKAKGVPKLKFLGDVKIKYCVFVPEKPKGRINLDEDSCVIDAREVLRY